MPYTQAHTEPPRSIWGWTLFALLLCFYVRAWTDVASIDFIPGYLLPVLTAWVAHVHGRRVVGLLVALAIPAAVRVTLQLTELVSVSYGLRTTGRGISTWTW